MHLPSALRFRVSQVGWALERHWRRARGRHGAFEDGEVSARAARLTDLWQRTWPEAEPLGYVLRVAYHQQWVRFHCLPRSKRYADNAEEYAEILGRHRTVLRQGSTTTTAWHVIATDWGWRDLAGGWSKRLLPGAWPWRRCQVDGDPEAGHHYFWATGELTADELDSLLLAAADDQAHFVIGAPGLEWLYCPYDGGADVLLPDPVLRDILRDRHEDWLPSNPSGL